MKDYENKTEKLTEPLRAGELKLPDGYSIPAGHGHKTSFRSVRETAYRGKSIRVETTYKVIIDREPLTTHTMVLDDGSVHCHDFPNYSFRSAMDMAKKIVDSAVEFDPPHDELSADDKADHGGHH